MVKRDGAAPSLANSQFARLSGYLTLLKVEPIARAARATQVLYKRTRTAESIGVNGGQCCIAATYFGFTKTALRYLRLLTVK